MPDFAYVSDGDEIYRRSFALIRDETDLARFSEEESEIIVRMIHSCGSVEIADAVVFGGDFVRCGREALRRGAPILCDSEMVSHGVTRSRLPARNEVVCMLHDARTARLAAEEGRTRSAAALDLWGQRMKGAVVAIGNAPTALFRLLELIGGGAPAPSAIVGIPVGFVGAGESKEALIENSYGVPFVTLRGRRGGSAIAAAAVNALARSE
jgi:precorrin-8X/cobalt-precorrin-8 methylmutase